MSSPSSFVVVVFLPRCAEADASSASLQIWLKSAIANDIEYPGITDNIITEHTALKYYQFSATRALYTSNGKAREDGAFLSPVSSPPLSASISLTPGPRRR